MTDVCIDTPILIWGVRREATPGQEPLIERAAMFLHYLDQNEIRVLVPSVAVGEFLVGIPEEQHAEVLHTLQRRFRIVDYDPPAAALAARLWQQRNDLLVVSSVEPQRQVIKADFQILAIAITRKASTLYTHDRQLLSMRQSYIRVSEMPSTLSQQQELFLPTIVR